MTRRNTILAMLAVPLAAGCAMLPGTDRASSAAEFEVGVEALERGDYAAGYEILYPIYRRHWDRPIGQSALLALTAAEIDPRNANRRLWSTADMAATYLQIPDAPAWTMPIARTLYLLALELGAAEERLARAEAERDQAQAQVRRARSDSPPARALPDLPGQSVPAQLRAVADERDGLRRRVQQLEQQLSERDRQLREREEELERIRRTIRG